MLEHSPHPLHVLAGLPPVSLGIKVAKKQFLLQACFDSASSPRDLSSDERFTATLRFMVEQDSVGCKQIVSASVVDCLKVGVRFRTSIW